MRLLKINAEGELSLVEYIDEQAAPSYAILSHRWGEDHEEVTLKDFIEDCCVWQASHERQT
jgi:hypothetical protein